MLALHSTPSIPSARFERQDATHATSRRRDPLVGPTLEHSAARWREFSEGRSVQAVHTVETPRAIHAALQGAWSLERFELVDDDGNAVDWFSGEAGPMMGSGTIIYSGDHMAVSLNSHGDKLSPAAKALNGILFYAGPFEVVGDSVVHQVTNASHPSLVQDFRRRVEFDAAEGTLRLVGTLPDGGEVVVEWKRLAS